MTRDPFYRQIVDALGRQLDPELFEHCASDLLRVIYPGLVPVRGGADSGVDGEIAHGSGNAILVCTTRDDVIGNVTASLNRYLSDGGAIRRVVVATSTSLTAKRRFNVQKRIEKLGFEHVQTHEQASFSDLLHHSPKWCTELLALSGERPALSQIPLSARPMLSIELVGRERELSWFMSSRGDRILVGQSGSGKTALMTRLAKDNEWLFLVSSNVEEVVPAIRESNPSGIVVDDAHVHIDLLVELKHLRTALDVDFSIIATCWPGSVRLVKHALMLAGDSVCDLTPLSATHIVDLLESAFTQFGVRVSDEWMRELVRQAKGRPGLAATLAYLISRGEVGRVFSGEVLLQDTVSNFRELVGPNATDVLGCFAVGGREGMRVEDVAGFVGLPPLEIRRVCADLASGGVIEERGSHLVVIPEALQHALIKDVFFCGASSLAIEPLLSLAPRPEASLNVLLGACLRGAEIPDTFLRSRLTENGSTCSWRIYSQAGAEQAQWVLENYPGDIRSVAEVLLVELPRPVIPILLDAAIGDEREPHSYPQHALRILFDWIDRGRPRIPEALERRRMLLESVVEWCPRGDARVAVRSAVKSMSIKYETAAASPDDTAIILRWTILNHSEIEELTKLWEPLLDMLRSVFVEDWRPVQELVQDWLIPDLRQVPAPDSLRNFTVAFAKKMTVDLANVARDRQGQLLWLKHLAKRCGFESFHQVDPDFEALFPEFDPDVELAAQTSAWTDTVNELVARWKHEAATVAAPKLVQWTQEAKSADLTWPNHLAFFCTRLANSIEQPGAWATALEDAGAPRPLMDLFDGAEKRGGT